jgi:transcriptional regulator with XRE-family HTH domain
VSQKTVAESLGQSERHYQRLEADPGNPKIETLIALADFFGVSIDYLVGRTDCPDVNRTGRASRPAS